MDLIKKLTGKKQADYEQAAAHIINNADSKSFEELVSKEDFLFDFIKQNVSKRLEYACNKDNFKNLLSFLSYYSPSYADFIAKTLAKYADDEVLSKMKELLTNGNDSEKCYSVKFYSYYKDNEVLETLKQYAFSEDEQLAFNSALALSLMGDKSSLDLAVEKMNSDDDFEVLSGVKFISAYGEKSLLNKIFEIMKKSSVSEYIASEIGYMESLLKLLNSEYYSDTLLAIYNILQGLGEIVPLSNVFTFQLYEVFERLIFCEPNSKNAVILLTAKNKFNQLTENDEYLFDEDKNTKEEVKAIKALLNDNLDEDLDNFIAPELNENSDFVYPALDLIKHGNLIRNLLSSKNQTIILKTLETLKSINELSQEDKNKALEYITDENIKAIVLAL